MRNLKNTNVLILLLLFACATLSAQQKQPEIQFSVTPNPQDQTFHVEMFIGSWNGDSVLLKMPAWTPGYYQLLHFADNVSDFSVLSKKKKQVQFVRVGRNGWRFSGEGKQFTVKYKVKATRSFVATPFVDQTRAYIAPTGVFMHVPRMIDLPVTVSLQMPDGWRADTGLTPMHIINSYSAENFDILYDSPILMGPLEELPKFNVKGVTHRFVGYKPGEFDRTLFMNDLRKIVEESVALIGHIPYNSYVFLGIGPGQGGIEHLNSTTFGFSGDALKSREGRNRMYSFLAHEYFHHYNVKRIRPIELGPFDYDKENRTNMLWVSEGLTVYYDLLLVRRAGLITDDEFLDGLRKRMLGFENKPGRLYQSATQASYNTWSDGPFGRTDDEINKTVSVYDKGAIVGWLLDFAIRHHTKNAKSLDDVMRHLYNQYYRNLKRGFTEDEFRKVCEDIAETKLDEVFSYASTVKELDYKKYLNYGGIEIDAEPKQVEGAWLGISTRMRNDSLLITNVEFESPAWKAGVKRGMKILRVNDQTLKSSIQPMVSDWKADETITLQVANKSDVKTITIQLAKKIEPSFRLTKSAAPSKSQQEIFSDWTASKVKK